MQQITTNGNNSIPLPGSREIASIRVAQSCGCGYPKLYVRYKGETQYVPLKISNAPSVPGLNNRYVDVFSNQAVNGVKSFGDYIKVSSSYIKGGTTQVFGDTKGGGLFNVLIGTSAGNAMTGQKNIMIGDYTCLRATAINNTVAIGVQSGPLTDYQGDNNFFLGYKAGYNMTGGSRNIHIGQGSGISGTYSDRLFIGNPGEPTNLESTHIITGYFNTGVLRFPKGYANNDSSKFLTTGSDGTLVLSDIKSVIPVPTVNDGKLTLGTSGIATGSGSFTANQATSGSFTVNVPGTDITATLNESKVLNISSSTGTGGSVNLSSLIPTNYVPTARTIIAGDGLSGGGDLSADRTIALGAPGSITAASANSVTATSHTHELGANSIVTTKIANSAVTFAKLQNIPAQTLMGRYATGTGVVQAVTLGTGLSLNASGVLSATNTSSGTVTSVGASTGGNAINVSGSPVTSSGTLVFGFQGTENQYINGIGNLVTFPTIPSGTVTSVTIGNGLTGASPITSAGTITLGTPGTITLSSNNSVTANSHTHAFSPGGTVNQYISGAGTLITFPTLSGFESVANKVTSLGGTLDATHYPSTKALDEWAFIFRGAFTGSAIDVDATYKSGMYRVQGTPAGTLPAGYSIATASSLQVYNQGITTNNFEHQVLTQTNGNSWWRMANSAGAWSDWKQYADRDWVLSQIPTVNNGQLELSTSGIATGSASFKANQATATSFTVNVPGTNITASLNNSTHILSINSSTGAGDTVDLTSIIGVDTNLGNTDLTVPNGIDRSVLFDYSKSLMFGTTQFNGNQSLLKLSGQGSSYQDTIGGGFSISTRFGTGAVGYFVITPSQLAMVNPLILLSTDGVHGGIFNFNNLTVDRTYTWQDKDGIVALLEDIPTDYVPISRTIIAGNGLTGGGDLSANRTITMGVPGDITATSTSAVTATSHTHALANGAVTYAKIQNIPTQTLLGRGATGAGVVSAITLGTGLSLSAAGVLSATNTNTGTVTNIAASIGGNALNVSGSPITSSGTLAFAFQGTAAQYVNGLGNLVNFPAIPTVNNGTLTLATGAGLTGSATFTANQAGSSTFTVGLNASLDSLNDVVNSSPVSGQLLRFDGTNWVNWTPNYLTGFTETDPVWVAARNATNLTVAGNVATTNFTTAADYYKPIGYSAMLSNASALLPEQNYGYFHVFGHRNQSNGWGGLFAVYNSEHIYYGRSIDSTTPQWVRLATVNDLPSNYMTTNTVQTSLTGNKSTTGKWLFRFNENTWYLDGTGAERLYFGTSAGNNNGIIFANSQLNQDFQFRPIAANPSVFNIGSGLTYTSNNFEIRTGANSTSYYLNLGSGSSTSTVPTIAAKSQSGGVGLLLRAAANQANPSRAAFTFEAYQPDMTSPINGGNAFRFSNGDNATGSLLDIIYDGRIIMPYLAGTGTRMVTASSTGQLGVAAITTGTVTSVTIGNGLTGTSPITSTGTVTLGTPSAITLSSANSVTVGSHTHAFTPGGTTAEYIRGNGTLATFPTIPTVGNGILTIQQNGSTVGTFSANQSANTTINLAGGSGTNEIVDNGYGYGRAKDFGSGWDATGGFAANSVYITSNTPYQVLERDYTVYLFAPGAAVILPDPVMYRNRMIRLVNATKVEIKAPQQYAIIDYDGTSLANMGVGSYLIQSIKGAGGAWLWYLVGGNS